VTSASLSIVHSRLSYSSGTHIFIFIHCDLSFMLAINLCQSPFFLWLETGLVKKLKGKLHFTPLELSIHLHFYLQSFKCDTLSPQTFKLWQFDHFDLFFFSQNAPITFFFLFLKKKYVGVAEPPHRATPTYFFFFLVFFFFWIFL
jgi:hypothetical protein